MRDYPVPPELVHQRPVQSLCAGGTKCFYQLLAIAFGQAKLAQTLFICVYISIIGALFIKSPIVSIIFLRAKSKCTIVLANIHSIIVHRTDLSAVVHLLVPLMAVLDFTCTSTGSSGFQPCFLHLLLYMCCYARSQIPSILKYI